LYLFNGHRVLPLHPNRSASFRRWLIADRLSCRLFIFLKEVRKRWHLTLSCVLHDLLWIATAV
jgi:hypothetical protein